MSKLSSIEGQVAVVTGGTAGIGQACCERFAEEGARVAIVGRNAERGEAILDTIRRSGGDAIFIQADCESEPDMKRSAQSVLDRWGKVEMLVNCAGGFRASPPIEEVDLETWNRGYALNVTTKFLITRELVPAMKSAGYGRIVNISSNAGRSGSRNAALEYATGKSAVIGFSRRLASELAPHGITVNVVAPGNTLSPRVMRHGEERIAERAKAVPVGRFSQPEEQAHAVWYFCTPGAGFTTGAVLDVNGGIWMG